MAEQVESIHHIVGLLPAVQEVGTLDIQLHGHALRSPFPTHLSCCECTSWVSQMLEPGSKGGNPPAALELGMESCYEQLSSLDVSTYGLI